MDWGLIRRATRMPAFICLALVLSNSASAIDIVVDYTFDTTNWYGAGNPSGATAGAQARATLDAAADFFSIHLVDDFSPIEVPANFVSAAFGGEVAWSWTQNVGHPSTGGALSIPNATLDQDEYVIYAGARPLIGSSIGLGGPGGFGLSQSIVRQGFTPSDITQVEQITDAFFGSVETRGETSGFASWGGAITFDPNANWHFDHLTEPTAGTNDLYSVALHELAHALGIGASDEWDALISGGFFIGSESVAEQLGNVRLDPSGGHWAEGTESTIFNSTAPQEAALDPTILNGTRKHITQLDAAGLVDIGWDFTAPVVELFCDFDGDSDCDHDDIDILYSTNPTSENIGNWLDQASTANGVELLIGDVNLNGEINSTDLGLLLNNFSAANAMFGGGDLNADSIVDSTDLGLLLNNFGAPGASAFVAVPEPSSLHCFVFLFAALLRFGLSGRRSVHST